MAWLPMTINSVWPLVQNDHGHMVFAYAKSWLTDATAIPLSQSLALTKKHFTRNDCRGFFAGILPDESKREIIARNLGISVRNDFAMLERIGVECAAAVTFIAEGGEPSGALPLPLADVRLTGGPLKHAQELDAAYLLSASCRLIPQDLTRCSK